MKKVFLSCCLAVLLLAGCDKDTDPAPTPTPTPTPIPTPTPPSDLIDITDGNAISETLVIEQSTKVTGTAPSSSGGDALVLGALDADLNLIGITGYQVRLPITERLQDQIEGLYLQVEGANDYYDIPLSGLSTERRKPTTGKVIEIPYLEKRLTYENYGLLLTLPEKLEEGSFNVSYAIYDAQGNVSNYLKTAIQSLRLGGEGSEFLMNASWANKINIFSDNCDAAGNPVAGTEDTIFVEYNNIEQRVLEDLICDDGTTQDVPYTLTRSTAAPLYSFNSNGEFDIKREHLLLYDSHGMICDTTIYDDYSWKGTLSGAWSYNQESQLLTTIVYEFRDVFVDNYVLILWEGYNPKTGQSIRNPLPKVYQYRVMQEGGKLYFHWDKTTRCYFKRVLEPQ